MGASKIKTLVDVLFLYIFCSIPFPVSAKGSLLQLFPVISLPQCRLWIVSIQVSRKREKRDLHTLSSLHLRGTLSVRGMCSMFSVSISARKTSSHLPRPNQPSADKNSGCLSKADWDLKIDGVVQSSRRGILLDFLLKDAEEMSRRINVRCVMAVYNNSDRLHSFPLLT